MARRLRRPLPNNDLFNSQITNTQSVILSPNEALNIEKCYRIVKRSVDARQRTLKVLLTIATDDNGQWLSVDTPVAPYPLPCYQDVHHAAQTVEIVGAGPAGLFAALTLLEHGIKPVIYERGKEVSERKKDIALLNRNEGLNPESNYCFGEGGAGTFSDGKLFSRSKKRGNMQRIMEIFHYFGASDRILYEAHAHIGSDKLPAIIRNMRECILAHGGEIHFGEKWLIPDSPTHRFTDSPVILAIGHSAHDTYRELYAMGVQMEAKGCAMGVRIEHPQRLINDIFYHHQPQTVIDLVGNASYSLVTQVHTPYPNSEAVHTPTRGVYSFCMCPGGHIVPAGSMNEGCVVNGMSASHRNSPFANSGMVVELHPEDMVDGCASVHNGLSGLDFQEHLEHLAYTSIHRLTGSPIPPSVAPAQRMKDFVEGKASQSLPECSYLPGIVPSRLDLWLPEPIKSGLQQGFKDFGRKYPGFLTNEAVILGVESRSSSPVRIVRNPETMQSTSHPWLYPCGEGAGYAGGITSSALDGIRAAEAAIEAMNK
ncbi:MAG: FAD-dependent monooxygenase [Paludibacteraceae bacterium]|nr:FAD-dependent monooxygenase [Paludibacteraceae bacterium]